MKNKKLASLLLVAFVLATTVSPQSTENNNQTFWFGEDCAHGIADLRCTMDGDTGGGGFGGRLCNGMCMLTLGI